MLIETETSFLATFDNFLTSSECEELLREIETLDLVSRPKFMMFGKPAQMNRDVGFFNLSLKGYDFTSQQMEAKELAPLLSWVLEKVNKELEMEFNGILINRYLDGHDYIGAHSDNEVDIVAGISLGASRIFRV